MIENGWYFLKKRCWVYIFSPETILPGIPVKSQSLDLPGIPVNTRLFMRRIFAFLKLLLSKSGMRGFANQGGVFARPFQTDPVPTLAFHRFKIPKYVKISGTNKAARRPMWKVPAGYSAFSSLFKTFWVFRAAHRFLFAGKWGWRLAKGPYSHILRFA